jgi:hypothetical protein
MNNHVKLDRQFLSRPCAVPEENNNNNNNNNKTTPQYNLPSSYGISIIMMLLEH